MKRRLLPIILAVSPGLLLLLAGCGSGSSAAPDAGGAGGADAGGAASGPAQVVEQAFAADDCTALVPTNADVECDEFAKDGSASITVGRTYTFACPRGVQGAVVDIEEPGENQRVGIYLTLLDGSWKVFDADPISSLDERGQQCWSATPSSGD